MKHRSVSAKSLEWNIKNLNEHQPQVARCAECAYPDFCLLWYYFDGTCDTSLRSRESYGFFLKSRSSESSSRKEPDVEKWGPWAMGVNVIIVYWCFRSSLWHISPTRWVPYPFSASYVTFVARIFCGEICSSNPWSYQVIIIPILSEAKSIWV